MGVLSNKTKGTALDEQAQLVATRGNLHEVAASLAPALQLVDRRLLDEVMAIAIERGQPDLAESLARAKEQGRC